jgi:preprotein translocase subunit YajC
MNWFIAEALADAAPAAGPRGGFDLQTILLFGGMFVVFWFLLIRPQQKRAKEHKTMLAALAKGDEVVVAGGMLGRVTQIGPAYVGVEVADKVEIKVQRPAIQAVLPKGTLKNANE